MYVHYYFSYFTYHQFQFNNHCYVYNQLNTLHGMLCSRRMNNTYVQVLVGINANNGVLSYNLQNIHMDM